MNLPFLIRSVLFAAFLVVVVLIYFGGWGDAPPGSIKIRP